MGAIWLLSCPRNSASNIGVAEIFYLRESRKWAIFHMPRSSGRSGAEVALLRLLQLQGRAFDPAVVNVMVTAFDDTLRELKLSTRHDPLVERVAQIIIECAEKGMRDAAEMRDCALKAIRNGAEH